MEFVSPNPPAFATQRQRTMRFIVYPLPIALLLAVVVIFVSDRTGSFSNGPLDAILLDIWETPDGAFVASSPDFRLPPNARMHSQFSLSVAGARTGWKWWVPITTRYAPPAISYIVYEFGLTSVPSIPRDSALFRFIDEHIRANEDGIARAAWIGELSQFDYGGWIRALPLAFIGIYPIVGLILISPIAYRDIRARHRLKWGRCAVCGYDLFHDWNSGCPECGWLRDQYDLLSPR
jgi:hypothetical protein